MNVANAKGWPRGELPRPATGLVVNAFATGLDPLRWIHVLPNSDVLVAETNAPQIHDQGFGIKKLFIKQAMKQAGTATKSANRITLLHDTNGDGVADDCAMGWTEVSANAIS